MREPGRVSYAETDENEEITSPQKAFKAKPRSIANDGEKTLEKTGILAFARRGVNNAVNMLAESPTRVANPNAGKGRSKPSR
jgi:hypothetical protein